MWGRERGERVAEWGFKIGQEEREIGHFRLVGPTWQPLVSPKWIFLIYNFQNNPYLSLFFHLIPLDLFHTF